MKTVQEKTDGELRIAVQDLVWTIEFDLGKQRLVWGLVSALYNHTEEQRKRHNAKLRAVGSEVCA